MNKTVTYKVGFLRKKGENVNIKRDKRVRIQNNSKSKLQYSDSSLFLLTF